jgi:AmmeMemoRadiSam system protein A
MESAFMVPKRHLSEDDRVFLLKLARESIENYVKQKPIPKINKKNLSKVLQEDGASFVTLTNKGYLRGCIGALEPYQSLVVDVQEHAIAAASQDYRFQPVLADEIDDIQIEISYLTRPEVLKYSNPEDLLKFLRPNIDGVVIRDGMRRATFLPQVWEKIPEPEEFLEQLCLKMGVSPDVWRRKKLDVLIYQVEEFHE